MIQNVCVYSVQGKSRFNENINDESFGMLYYAEIKSFGELKNEMEEITISKNLPTNWKYPEIQPILLDEVKKRGFF